MSSAMAASARRSVGIITESASRSVSNRAASRSIHSTASKKAGHGSSHDEGYDYYLHAPRMYNLDRMKHQKLKMTLLVWGLVAFGAAVPIYAVHFQQKKRGAS